MPLAPLRRPSLRRVGPACFGALAALAALAPADAAADTKADTKSVHVLHLASNGRDSYDALRLTKQLEHRFVAANEVRLVNSSQSLLELLTKAKCGRPFIKHLLARQSAGDVAGREPDAACLAKVAAVIGRAGGGPVESYVWGSVGRDPAGKGYALLHLWQKGQPDRQARLPYASEQSEQVADRAYLKLLHPTESGDARVLPFAEAAGNLWIDDQDRGPFAPNAELTLRTGEHTFELRQEAKVVARAKASVSNAAPVEVRLEAVPEPPAPVAAALPAPAPTSAPGSTASARFDTTTSPPLETARRSKVLPWVAFGAGAAALAGAGVFFALRQGKESDLDEACVNGCPPSQQATIDASKRYGTLSLVLGGVGVAAVGVGVWSLLRAPAAPRTTAVASLPSRPGTATASLPYRPGAAVASPPDRPDTADARRPGPALRYDVVPLAGGAAASLSGSF
jgi:hypothetical protein